MRLLIITQAVDLEDPIMGFFHNWISEFSKRCEMVNVICLKKGEYNLPLNVKVLSLGKVASSATSRGGWKKIKSKSLYIFRFYKYIWQERGNYDAVFVHMNQEYVLLGGLFWKMAGKRVFIWRNHSMGSLLTKAAVFLSDKVFCTSPYSFTAKFKKTIIMPVGIDTNVFTESRIMNPAQPNYSGRYELRKRKILFLSRMSPIKRPDLLVEALKIVKEKNIDFICHFYGDALPKHKEYFDGIKNKVDKYGLNENIKFFKEVPNYKTPEIYNEHEIFVNLTPSGSFDKTILEASACGCIPIIVNKSLENNLEFLDLILTDDSEKIADTIGFWLNASSEEIDKKSSALKMFVENNHSLEYLSDRLFKLIN